MNGPSETATLPPPATAQPNGGVLFSSYYGHHHHHHHHPHHVHHPHHFPSNGHYHLYPGEPPLIPKPLTATNGSSANSIEDIHVTVLQIDQQNRSQQPPQQQQQQSSQPKLNPQTYFNHHGEEMEVMNHHKPPQPSSAESTTVIGQDVNGQDFITVLKIVSTGATILTSTSTTVTTTTAAAATATMNGSSYHNPAQRIFVDNKRGEIEEEVTIYRLPGERLGMALRFDGGQSVAETIHRVFVQSITLNSPSSKAIGLMLGMLREGDEILQIDGRKSSSLTRLECITLLRDAPVCIRLFVRRLLTSNHNYHQPQPQNQMAQNCQLNPQVTSTTTSCPSSSTSTTTTTTTVPKVSNNDCCQMPIHLPNGHSNNNDQSQQQKQHNHAIEVQNHHHHQQQQQQQQYHHHHHHLNSVATIPSTNNNNNNHNHLISPTNTPLLTQLLNGSGLNGLIITESSTSTVLNNRKVPPPVPPRMATTTLSSKRKPRPMPLATPPPPPPPPQPPSASDENNAAEPLPSPPPPPIINNQSSDKQQTMMTIIQPNGTILSNRNNVVEQQNKHQATSINTSPQQQVVAHNNDQPSTTAVVVEKPPRRKNLNGYGNGNPPPLPPRRPKGPPPKPPIDRLAAHSVVNVNFPNGNQTSTSTTTPIFTKSLPSLVTVISSKASSTVGDKFSKIDVTDCSTTTTTTAQSTLSLPVICSTGRTQLTPTTTTTTTLSGGTSSTITTTANVVHHNNNPSKSSSTTTTKVTFNISNSKVSSFIRHTAEKLHRKLSGKPTTSSCSSASASAAVAAAAAAAVASSSNESDEDTTTTTSVINNTTFGHHGKASHDNPKRTDWTKTSVDAAGMDYEQRQQQQLVKSNHSGSDMVGYGEKFDAEKYSVMQRPEEEEERSTNIQQQQQQQSTVTSIAAASLSATNPPTATAYTDFSQDIEESFESDTDDTSSSVSTIIERGSFTDALVAQLEKNLNETDDMSIVDRVLSPFEISDQESVEPEAGTAPPSSSSSSSNRDDDTVDRSRSIDSSANYIEQLSSQNKTKQTELIADDDQLMMINKPTFINNSQDVGRMRKMDIGQVVGQQQPQQSSSPVESPNSINNDTDFRRDRPSEPHQENDHDQPKTFAESIDVPGTPGDDDDDEEEEDLDAIKNDIFSRLDEDKDDFMIDTDYLNESSSRFLFHHNSSELILNSYSELSSITEEDEEDDATTTIVGGVEAKSLDPIQDKTTIDETDSKNDLKNPDVVEESDGHDGDHVVQEEEEAGSRGIDSETKTELLVECPADPTTTATATSPFNKISLDNVFEFLNKAEDDFEFVERMLELTNDKIDSIDDIMRIRESLRGLQESEQRQNLQRFLDGKDVFEELIALSSSSSSQSSSSSSSSSSSMLSSPSSSSRSPSSSPDNGYCPDIMSKHQSMIPQMMNDNQQQQSSSPTEFTSLTVCVTSKPPLPSPVQPAPRLLHHHSPSKIMSTKSLDQSPAPSESKIPTLLPSLKMTSVNNLNKRSQSISNIFGKTNGGGGGGNYSSLVETRPSLIPRPISNFNLNVPPTLNNNNNNHRNFNQKAHHRTSHNCLNRSTSMQSIFTTNSLSRTKTNGNMHSNKGATRRSSVTSTTSSSSSSINGGGGGGTSNYHHNCLKNQDSSSSYYGSLSRNVSKSSSNVYNTGSLPRPARPASLMKNGGNMMMMMAHSYHESSNGHGSMMAAPDNNNNNQQQDFRTTSLTDLSSGLISSSNGGGRHHQQQSSSSLLLSSAAYSNHNAYNGSSGKPPFSSSSSSSSSLLVNGVHHNHNHHYYHQHHYNHNSSNNPSTTIINDRQYSLSSGNLFRSDSLNSAINRDCGGGGGGSGNCSQTQSSRNNHNNNFNSHHQHHNDTVDLVEYPNNGGSATSSSSSSSAIAFGGNKKKPSSSLKSQAATNLRTSSSLVSLVVPSLTPQKSHPNPNGPVVNNHQHYWHCSNHGFQPQTSQSCTTLKKPSSLKFRPTTSLSSNNNTNNVGGKTSTNNAGRTQTLVRRTDTGNKSSSSSSCCSSTSSNVQSDNEDNHNPSNNSGLGNKNIPQPQSILRTSTLSTKLNKNNSTALAQQQQPKDNNNTEQQQNYWSQGSNKSKSKSDLELLYRSSSSSLHSDSESSDITISSGDSCEDYLNPKQRDICWPSKQPRQPQQQQHSVHHHHHHHRVCFMDQIVVETTTRAKVANNGELPNMPSAPKTVEHHDQPKSASSNHNNSNNNSKMDEHPYSSSPEAAILSSSTSTSSISSLGSVNGADTIMMTTMKTKPSKTMASVAGHHHNDSKDGLLINPHREDSGIFASDYASTSDSFSQSPSPELLPTANDKEVRQDGQDDSGKQNPLLRDERGVLFEEVVESAKHQCGGGETTSQISPMNPIKSSNQLSLSRSSSAPCETVCERPTIPSMVPLTPQISDGKAESINSFMSRDSMMVARRHQNVCKLKGLIIPEIINDQDEMDSVVTDDTVRPEIDLPTIVKEDILKIQDLEKSTGGGGGGGGNRKNSNHNGGDGKPIEIIPLKPVNVSVPKYSPMFKRRVLTLPTNRSVPESNIDNGEQEEESQMKPVPVIPPKPRLNSKAKMSAPPPLPPKSKETSMDQNVEPEEPRTKVMNEFVIYQKQHSMRAIIFHLNDSDETECLKQLGITIKGGFDSDTDHVTVEHIEPDGLAAQDGRLQKGDRIISINGKRLAGMTHNKILDLLKNSCLSQKVTLVCTRPHEKNPEDPESPLLVSDHRPSAKQTVDNEPNPSANMDANNNNNNNNNFKLIRADITKDVTGLGFIIEGGQNSSFGDRPITIKRIFRGGPVDKEGTLLEGDELLFVNDRPVDKMTRAEAWNFLKQLPDGKVSLIVRRRKVAI